MKSIICFSKVKSIMFDKYNIKLYDWDNDFEARKGIIAGKSSFRHDSDSLDGLDDESVAKMFSELATNYGGTIVSIRGVSLDDEINHNPFVFILSEKKN